LLLLPYYISCAHYKVTAFVVVLLMAIHPTEILLTLLRLSRWYLTWTLWLFMFFFVLLNYLWFRLNLLFFHFKIRLLLLYYLFFHIISEYFPILFDYIFFYLILVFLFYLRILISLLEHILLFAYNKLCEFLFVCIIVLRARALIKMKLPDISMSWFVLVIQYYVFLL